MRRLKESSTCGSSWGHVVYAGRVAQVVQEEEEEEEEQTMRAPHDGGEGDAEVGALDEDRSEETEKTAPSSPACNHLRKRAMEVRRKHRTYVLLPSSGHATDTWKTLSLLECTSSRHVLFVP